MNAPGVLPGHTRRVMEMPREDPGIRLCQPVRRCVRGWFFCRIRPFCGGVLFRIFQPAIFQSLPVDLLEIEVALTIEIFRELGAPGLKLRNGGEAGSRGALSTSRKHLTKGVDAAGAENHIGGDRQVEEIPLRDARTALFSAERDFQERGVTFIALRSELIAENCANQFEGFGLLADAKKIDLLRAVHRRTGLHRGELSAEQSESVRQRHTEARLSDGIDDVSIALLALRKSSSGNAFHGIINASEVKLRRGIGDGISGN